MNKSIYITLACGVIFLAICIGIRFKDNISSSTSTITQNVEQKPSAAERPDIAAIVETSENKDMLPQEQSNPSHGPILSIAGLKNMVINPSANNGIQAWTVLGNVTIEPVGKRKNPCFTLLDKGRLKQKVDLRNSDMQYVVVATCGSTERVNNDNKDPAGLPLLRTYFEDKTGKSNSDDAIAIVMSMINQNGWGQVGIVQQIPTNTKYIHLELHQAPGKTPVNSATKFDDVFVTIARNKEAGNKMLESYIKQADAFSR